MGCGNSKTTATESTPSVRPPQQVDTPVEDIRGQNLQGSGPAIAPEPNNHTGNTHKSDSTGEPNSVGIEQTAVEKFTNSEDNHSDKLPRDDDKNENPNEQVEGNNSDAQAEGAGNVRPSSAISVDSVAVRALVNHTINKAAANVCVLQGKAVQRDVRPSSVASSVDSVAVRALVDATITKAAAGLKENSANSASLTENTDQTEVKKEKYHEDEAHSAPTNVQVEDTSNPTIVVSTVPTLNFDDSLDDTKPQPENDPSKITEDQAPKPSKDTIITSSEAVDDNTESQVPDGPDSKQEQQGSLDSSTQNENSNGNSNTKAEDQLNPQPEEALITSDETDGVDHPLADPGDVAPEADDGQIQGTVVVSSEAKDTVPAPVSNTSENTVPQSSKELDPKAQESFDRAIRAFCPLMDPKNVLDLVVSSVRSLHLDHAPLQADSSFTQLFTKLTDVEEINLGKNEMGPQAFRVVMMALSANTSIKSAVLSNNKTDTDTAESVGVMLMTNQTLESLDLSSNQLGKDYLSRCIGPSLKTNTSLTSLNISSCGGTDLNVLMEGLLENTTLSSLNVSHNQLSDSTALVTSLSAVLKNSLCAIKELNVRNCGIQGTGLQILGEGVKENSSLITLHAGGNDVSNVNVFVEFLVTCLQHASIETLNLNDTRISEMGNQNLDLPPINEKRKSSLKNLNLANCSITDEIMKVLANHLPACLPHITELSLSGNSEMTTASLQSVAQLTALIEGSVSSGVTHLHLDQQSLEGLPDHLLNNPSFSSLTMLSLCKARISPTSLGRLSDLLQGPGGLTELCLSGLKLSETEALTQLLKPAANLSLKGLSLAGCALKDSDLEPLTSALAAGWCVTSLTVANNRLTCSGINPLLEAMISSGEPLLESLNLNSNQLSDDCQDVLTSLLTKAKKLHTLSFNRNSLGCETLSALIQSLHLAESLKLLDLRNQESPLDEEDMEELMKKLAGELGYTLHEDEYGGIEAGRGPLPSRSSDLSILLTGLGADLGPVGRSLDSAMVKTDHGVKHPLPLSLQHALQLGAWMTAQDPTSQPELSAASWEAIIGIRKDSAVPSWLKVESLRCCAVYISNLSSNVSPCKLEGDLDAEADCNVKEVCIMKDPIQRKPNGYAWVLMADQESVKRAMDFYYSGQALMFSQPYIISPVSLKLPDLTTDDTIEDQVSEEMARREKERVAEAAKHQQLLETSFAASRARHEYAKAHPAYADGRIF